MKEKNVPDDHVPPAPACTAVTTATEAPAPPRAAPPSAAARDRPPWRSRAVTEELRSGGSGPQPGSDGARGPLHDVRVLDLGTVYAAPITAMLLGDYGAEVIK